MDTRHPFCVVCGAASTQFAPGSGNGYCATCGQCRRCRSSVEAFVFYAKWQIWVCQCVKEIDERHTASKLGETVKQAVLL